jgi:predicted nucleotidyltransferase
MTIQTLQTQLNPRLDVLLRSLKSKLNELYGQRLYSLILFGSQARGEANEDSDIDIMAVLEDPVNVITEIQRMSDISQSFLDQHGELISIIPMSKSRFLDSAISLIRVVKKEGITL